MAAACGVDLTFPGYLGPRQTALGGRAFPPFPPAAVGTPFSPVPQHAPGTVRSFLHRQAVFSIECTVSSGLSVLLERNGRSVFPESPNIFFRCIITKLSINIVTYLSIWNNYYFLLNHILRHLFLFCN